MLYRSGRARGDGALFPSRWTKINQSDLRLSPGNGCKNMWRRKKPSAILAASANSSSSPGKLDVVRCIFIAKGILTTLLVHSIWGMFRNFHIIKKHTALMVLKLSTVLKFSISSAFGLSQLNRSWFVSENRLRNRLQTRSSLSRLHISGLIKRCGHNSKLWYWK